MYFVRNNDKTRYFFNSLLLAGDLIASTHSHQIALISLLNEHASLYNLKVKILSRDSDEFPGGFTYHRRRDYMKDLFAGKVKPYLFVSKLIVSLCFIVCPLQKGKLMRQFFDNNLLFSRKLSKNIETNHTIVAHELDGE